jgi:hypothetical protein
VLAVALLFAVLGSMGWLAVADALFVIVPFWLGFTTILR